MNEPTGHCKHGEFVLTEGCVVCMAEAASTAEIAIRPDLNETVQRLKGEGEQLRDFASKREIKEPADEKPATDDLAMIAINKKHIREVQATYVAPIKEHLAAVTDFFKGLLAPYEEADVTNRMKIRLFREEQQKKADAIEQLNREAADIARRQAEANDGEITISSIPIEAPHVPKTTRTDLGSTGGAKIWKFRVVDKALVPEEYKVVDMAMVGKVVRASQGNIVIPGIETYPETVIKVNTRA